MCLERSTKNQPKLTSISWLVIDKMKMSRLVTKPTKWHVRPAKTQISLGIRPVWSESSLSAQWVAKDPRFLPADSEDSGQIGRMPRLIWVFAGRTCHFVGFVMRRLKCYTVRLRLHIPKTLSYKLLILFKLYMCFNHVESCHQMGNPSK